MGLAAARAAQSGRLTLHAKDAKAAKARSPAKEVIMGLYWGYIGAILVYIGVILGYIGDNGKENGSYYLGFRVG